MVTNPVVIVHTEQMAMVVMVVVVLLVVWSTLNFAELKRLSLF